MKRQRRIETFFQSNQSELTYFYAEQGRATWLYEEPSNLKFHKEIEWQRRLVTVAANFSSTEALEKKTLDTSLIAIIKSNLQKCIRRQLKTRALQTAKLFMMVDMVQFIRRLVIIMLEDVALHESLTLLVWLTAAVSKGFVVDRRMASWLLGVVNYLCQEQRHDFPNESRDDDEKKYYRDAIHHKNRDILLSLLFRKSYGGMPGDMTMIINYVALLLTNDRDVSQTPLCEINFDDIECLSLEDTTLCSIDFHCYPALVFCLARENRDLSPQDIKAAIWHFNSKMNTRVKSTQQDERLSRIWSRIQRRVWFLQKTYLTQCINVFTNQQMRLASSIQ
jgi:hypothetical protein